MRIRLESRGCFSVGSLSPLFRTIIHVHLSIYLSLLVFLARGLARWFWECGG